MVFPSWAACRSSVELDPGTLSRREDLPAVRLSLRPLWSERFNTEATEALRALCAKA
jgi:hypothetical protein